MPNIHHALFIGVPAEKLYGAITTRQGLAAWWTPDAEAKAEVDSIAHFPFGPDYFKEMKITEFKPSELVEWRCMSGDAEWIGTTLSFRLLAGNNKSLLHSNPEVRGQIEQQRNDKGVLLIFHHNGWRNYTPMFAECSYTWGQFLRSLKLFCETGKGRPWPNQHRIEL